MHPPGGAAALTAVIAAAGPGGGWWFPLVPIAINSVILVAFGMLFHRLLGRQYPHRQSVAPINTHMTDDPPPAFRVGFNTEDIDAAVASLNETLDISRADLDALLRQVELQALLRQRGELTCADIMSRDVVTVAVDAMPEVARAHLLEHDIRTLPVIDGEGRLLGTVGLRELAVTAPSGHMPVSEAATASPTDPAIGLLPRLTDGTIHAVVVVDEGHRVVGIISQTDLLATLATSISQTGGNGLMAGHGQGI